jgi:hypothetical protein
MEKVWNTLEFIIERKGPDLLSKTITDFSKRYVNHPGPELALKGKKEPLAKFKPWIASLRKSIATSKKPLIQNLSFQSSATTGWLMAHFISQKDWIFESRTDPTDKIVLHRFLLFLTEVFLNWWLAIVCSALEETGLTDTEKKALLVLKSSLEGWTRGVKTGATSRKQILTLLRVQNTPLVFPMGVSTKEFLYKVISAFK